MEVKSTKAKIIDSAVANYSSQPGYLNKADAKKQRSGRASSQDNFADREETERAWHANKSDIW